jgi:hypothetical protein
LPKGIVEYANVSVICATIAHSAIPALETITRKVNAFRANLRKQPLLRLVQSP